MRYIIFLLLSACSTVKYTDGQATFERTSYFTFTQINELVVTVNGAQKSVKLNATSDQVQVAEKVAEGVAKGLASSIKP